MVLFIYRDEVYNPGTPDNPNRDSGIAEIIIAKQRNGPVGTLPLAFEAPSTRFGDLAKADVAGFWNRKK